MHTGQLFQDNIKYQILEVKTESHNW